MAADRQPLIEARDVWRIFREPRARVEVAAVRGVSLRIERGEFVAVAGPSGSGKSTLLHLLSGIDVPTRGEVLLLNVTISSATAEERARLRLQHVGLLLSDNNLSPALTVGENIELPLELRGFDGAQCRKRADAALGMLQIQTLARSYPSALSSGERQRAALARALAGNPDCIFADEPTSHLDSAIGVALLDALAAAVRERNISIVVASHDPAVLARATRIIQLRDGAVVSGAR
ncbi:MAG: ATP-binding cassette domain-containing protein [Planctomycetes bacterium]|nr:ATP-binding cassette domain-containing protein [Planctomycetota bacterium]